MSKGQAATKQKTAAARPGSVRASAAPKKVSEPKKAAGSKVEPKIESKIATKIEPKITSKITSKIAPKLAPKAEEAAADDEDESDGELVEAKPKPLVTASGKEPAERTDDPVRMYLREMGSVELLSREGEIAIAKRIEAGREAMIAGLCESPLTFQAIIIWRDELNEGKVSLRNIIDLEAP